MRMEKRWARMLKRLENAAAVPPTRQICGRDYIRPPWDVTDRRRTVNRRGVLSARAT
jgi:hypothetical protein